ncbi:MAG: DUF1805 domain-containing protein [Candidatus Hydrogenedens sp.]|nr:DUF1805 domain-containing protein [Candidatus Hydrogenedens sp.]
MDWTGFDRFHIGLKRPLLLVRGSKGVLACGYLKVETFNKTGELAAIVTGVDDFDAMPGAKLIAVSNAAAAAGLAVGQSGREALELFR